MHGGQHFLVLRRGVSWQAKAGKSSLYASKLRANEKKKNSLPVIVPAVSCDKTSTKGVYDAALSRDLSVLSRVLTK